MKYNSSKSDYKMQNIFEIFHHIIISKYTLECTQIEPYLNIFLGRGCPESPSNKIAQRYATHDIASRI